MTAHVGPLANLPKLSYIEATHDERGSIVHGNGGLVSGSATCQY